MNYPLQLSFKLLAIAQQITATDANGGVIFYVKQKAFKLKETVTVFADTEQTRPLFHLNADRIIDFSAKYHMTDAQGRAVGTIKREGMKSLWKARYSILAGDNVVLTITEANPWVKVLDGLLSEVPLVGFFSGYFFHPAYVVSRPDGTMILRLQKQRAFFEGRFHIEQRTEMSSQEEVRALLGLIMMLLLERARG